MKRQKKNMKTLPVCTPSPKTEEDYDFLKKIIAKNHFKRR